MPKRRYRQVRTPWNTYRQVPVGETPFWEKKKGKKDKNGNSAYEDVATGATFAKEVVNAIWDFL